MGCLFVLALLAFIASVIYFLASAWVFWWVLRVAFVLAVICGLIWLVVFIIDAW